MKFALLSYSTNNLGDEIQSIAVQQFLPSTDLLIDRDNWQASVPYPEGPFRIVLNGWFSHSPENWPPPQFLSPLLTSVHISQERFLPSTLVAASVALVQGECLAYLRKHAPIGARDLWTAAHLKKNGVDSYFSACATLTLGDNSRRERGNYICAVDLPGGLYDELAVRAKTPIHKIAHRDPTGGSFEKRCKTAARLLSTYARAKCVVTTRLHCALPCLALGTPVLLVMTARDEYRFSGLLDLMRNCSPDAFKAGHVDFDFDNPKPNSDAHLPYRTSMINRLQAFANTRVSPFQPASLVDVLAELHSH